MTLSKQSLNLVIDAILTRLQHDQNHIEISTIDASTILDDLKMSVKSIDDISKNNTHTKP